MTRSFASHPFKLLFAATLVIGLGVGAHAAEITMATWGGAYGTTFKKELAEPFEKATGIHVNMIFGNSFSNFQKILAQRNHPQIDVATFASDIATEASEQGLIAELDPKELPNLNLKEDRGLRYAPDGKLRFVPFYMLGYGILYRTDLSPVQITSWKDLWNPDLVNKVGVTSPKLAGAAFLLTINKLTGGTEADVSPGLAKIKSLGKNLLLVEDNDARQLQLITQGEVWAQTVVIGDGVEAIKKGLKAKYVVPKEGSAGVLDVLAVVKNSPNPEGARKFANFILARDRIKAVVERIGAMPTNPEVQLDPAVAGIAAATKEDQTRLFFFNEDSIIKNRAKWSEMWDREITPMTQR